MSRNLQKPQTFVFRGGLDLVSQPMAVAPGFVIGAQNYESEVRGYRRSEGYERFDGQPKPSEAGYWVLGFQNGSAAILAGSTVTGAASGATGIALYTTTAETGTFGGGDAAGDLVMYGVSGSFEASENLQVSASTVATADGLALAGGAATDADDTTYTRAAIEAVRGDIAALPGEGGTLGIMSLLGSIYAVRNATGGATAKIYKATASGWSEVGNDTLEIDFTSGSTEPSEGDTLTGATSGATAVVQRVVRQSGTWSGGDAAGYLVLRSQTGTFVSENIDSGGANVLSIGGDTSAVTLPPGGKYRSINHNFYGASNLRRVYFVNGQGRAFEFDGTVLAPIKTGITEALDKPLFIGVHSNHLVLGYAGGFVNVSGTGLPLSFSSTDGAAEFSIGEDITGIQSAARTATVITGRNKVSYLTGTDSANFDLKDISGDSGARADTLQLIGDPHFVDDRGLRSLSASDKFGDWAMGTKTRRVEPLFRGNKTLGIAGSLRVRAKDQYRLYWEDGTGLSVYFGRQDAESMPLLLQFTPTVLYSLEDADGNEILLAGDSSGWVYQLDSGTSADGEDLSAFLRLPFLNQGDPNIEKRYHRSLLDVSDGGGAGSTLQYSSDVSYGDPNSPAAPEGTISLSAGGGFWDQATWDNFYWDSATQGRGYMDLDQIGENISIAIFSDATYEIPHTLASMTINFTVRRRIR